MKTNVFLFLGLLCALFVSCDTKNQPVTSKEILSKTLKFHDPDSAWPKFNYSLHFESSFKWNDSIPEELMIWVDVPGNDFSYKNLDRKVEVNYPDTNCNVIEGGDICGNYGWTKNFYTYVWGLPMKIKDPGVQLNEDFERVSFNGKGCYQIGVNYKKEDWKYFIDSTNYNMVGFQFEKKDGSNKGERIFLSNNKKLGPFFLPFKRVWTDLKTGDTLGTNVLIGYHENRFK